MAYSKKHAILISPQLQVGWSKAVSTGLGSKLQVRSRYVVCVSIFPMSSGYPGNVLPMTKGIKHRRQVQLHRHSACALSANIPLAKTIAVIKWSGSNSDHPEVLATGWMHKTGSEELRSMIHSTTLDLINIKHGIWLFPDTGITLLNTINCHKKGKWSMKSPELNSGVPKAGKHSFVSEWTTDVG